jgi:hypothetical protein
MLALLHRHLRPRRRHRRRRRRPISCGPTRGLRSHTTRSWTICCRRLTACLGLAPLLPQRQEQGQEQQQRRQRQRQRQEQEQEQEQE